MKKLLKKIATLGTYSFLFASQAWAQVEEITIEEPDEGVKDFGTLISAGIKISLLLAALLTFAYLIYGGLQWIMSGGDKTKYEAARDRITAALIGLAIVAAAWALMKLIEYFFGISILGGFTIPSAAE